MYNTENVKKDKNKKLNWTLVNNQFRMKEKWKANAHIYGYFVWPRTGDFVQEGEEIYFANVGQEIIDSTNIQGTRIVKDLMLRVTGASSITDTSFFIAVCKYNKSYGGRPYPSFDPVPDSVTYGNQFYYSAPLIEYYQSVLGYAVFHGEKSDEMIINCKDVILDSNDSIMVCMGNLNLIGRITHEGDYDYQPYVADTNTYVSVAGVVSCAVAYL